MKFVTKTFLLTLALAPLYAGQLAENYAQAQSVAGADGYILVAYPDGWDKGAEANSKKWLQSAAVMKAGGDAAFIPVPIPQIATDAVKEARKTLLGTLNLPVAHSYPALIFFNKEGRHVSTANGLEMRTMSPKKLASVIKKRLTNVREQQRLLDAAEGVQGEAKARLLGAAARVPDVNRPQNIIDRIREADPEDKAGYVRSLSFNPWVLAERAATAENKQEIFDTMDKMLADDAYTDDQKQKICATYIGHLRRTGGPRNIQRIPAMASRMKAYDPNSPEGLSADAAVRQWVSEFTLKTGWTPGVISTSPEEPMELQGELPISGAGEYEVTFRYTSGSHKMSLIGVELYDGDTKVAEDRHAGSTGDVHVNNVYTLKVGEQVSRPRLLIYVNMPAGETDSFGAITIEKK